MTKHCLQIFRLIIPKGDLPHHFHFETDRERERQTERERDKQCDSQLLVICNTDISELDEGINLNPFPNEKYGQGEHIGTT